MSPGLGVGTFVFSAHSPLKRENLWFCECSRGIQSVNLPGQDPRVIGLMLGAARWGVNERAVIATTGSSDLGCVSGSYRIQPLNSTQSYVSPYRDFDLKCDCDTVMYRCALG